MAILLLLWLSPTERHTPGRVCAAYEHRRAYGACVLYLEGSRELGQSLERAEEAKLQRGFTQVGKGLGKCQPPLQKRR